MARPPKPKHESCTGLLAIYFFAILVFCVGGLIGAKMGCPGVFFGMVAGYLIYSAARNRNYI